MIVLPSNVLTNHLIKLVNISRKSIVGLIKMWCGKIIQKKRVKNHFHCYLNSNHKVLRENSVAWNKSSRKSFFLLNWKPSLAYQRKLIAVVYSYEKLLQDLWDELIERLSYRVDQTDEKSFKERKLCHHWVIRNKT